MNKKNSKAKVLPSKKYLLECFKYNAETGYLIWRKRPLRHFKSDADRRTWTTKFAGCIAGSANDFGYLIVRINREKFRVHRLIWKIVHGYDPDVIDHINHDVSDNRMSNLRSVTFTENVRNIKKMKTNTSGVTGVSWSKSCNKWLVQMCLNNKHFNLGLYGNIFDAVCARKSAENKHGFICE